MLNPNPKVTVFGDSVFTKVIRIEWGYKGLDLIELVLL